MTVHSEKKVTRSEVTICSQPLVTRCQGEEPGKELTSLVVQWGEVEIHGHVHVVYMKDQAKVTSFPQGQRAAACLLLTRLSQEIQHCLPIPPEKQETVEAAMIELVCHLLAT